MKKAKNKTVHIITNTYAYDKSLEYNNKYHNHYHVKKIAFFGDFSPILLLFIMSLLTFDYLKLSKDSKY